MNSNCHLLLIRHGERLDEIHKDLWARQCATELKSSGNATRSASWFKKDPPLTANGISMARQVGSHLLHRINNIQSIVVHTSKMRRAVQTAFEIVKTMNEKRSQKVIIIACTGLAEACGPVRKSKGV